MSRSTPSNTYTRIIEAALTLFNEEGERHISTNHIAAHLGISPGNLYYHFRNKDEIIVQLHQRYSNDMMTCIQSAEAPQSLQDVANHLENVFSIMWHYRFLFSDMNALLLRNAELLGAHNVFTREKASPLVQRYLAQLAKIGIIEGSQEDIQSLALNMWIITKYWFDFHGSVRGKRKLQEDSKHLGVLRNLSLIRPYLTEQYRQEWHEVVKDLLSRHR